MDDQRPKPHQLGLIYFIVYVIYTLWDGVDNTLEPTLDSWVRHFAPGVALTILFVALLGLFRWLQRYFIFKD